MRRLTAVFLAVLILLVAILALRPVPRLISGFGLTSLPPEDKKAAFASFKVEFRNWFRYLVAIDDISFRDNSGTYVFEDIWIVQSGSGCAVFADSLEEVGRFPLTPVKGYKITGRDLNIMLRLGITGTANVSGDEYAGPNMVTFRLRFAGLPYVCHVEWDPNQ